MFFLQLSPLLPTSGAFSFASVFVCMLLLVSCGVALPVLLAGWRCIPRFACGFCLSWAALPHPQGYRNIGVGVRICAFAAFSLPAGLALGILACRGEGIHIDMYHIGNTKPFRWCAEAGGLGASPAPDSDQGNIALPRPGANKWFVHLRAGSRNSTYMYACSLVCMHVCVDVCAQVFSK